ncbi:GNAT family N-acetyltransferase [Kitasatospora cathayae]|uniref:GNAT family N-acetyltransferase n=1 Tax=Kitasatospora cathayae TaxID=3004092 RepID=A0ABY7Q2I1_9ACTN|nr:GNAT family N-acetyltransferase [Kitasatospora sp. HUAS 3-15]WBP86692.1 GNAT family N-acetyltransferase [Kitasatospora sp. HUAS 3-15]
MTETAVLTIRRASEADLPAIVAMLADDPLGATRETPADLTPYRAAFTRIDGDPHQHLVVAERAGRTIGTLHLTLVPGLSRTGATRAIIEAVRVHADERGSGLGTELIRWAVERARELGADLVQLTSDATRTDAHRFYERLGFVPSHLGFKLALSNRDE